MTVDKIVYAVCGGRFVDSEFVLNNFTKRQALEWLALKYELEVKPLQEDQNGGYDR